MGTNAFNKMLQIAIETQPLVISKIEQAEISVDRLMEIAYTSATPFIKEVMKIEHILGIEEGKLGDLEWPYYSRSVIAHRVGDPNTLHIEVTEHSPKIPLTVFISHSSQDSDFATQLSSDLQNLNIDTWLDSTHLKAGNFVDRINLALERDILLLILSPAAIHSSWVNQEMDATIVRHHLGLMKEPIIVMAQPCMPKEIPGLWSVYQRYDATDKTKYDAAFQKILIDLLGS